MFGASLVDVDALWHVALYSFVAVVGVVIAYGTLVLALDRVQRDETTPGRARRLDARHGRLRADLPGSADRRPLGDDAEVSVDVAPA
jgi:hypothetical protein